MIFNCLRLRPQSEAEHHDGYTALPLASCEYFTVRELETSGEAVLAADDKSFHSLLVLDGSLSLAMDGEQMELKKGDSVFIPAGAGAYRLSGAGKVILTTV